jgi:hypothetical protein
VIAAIDGYALRVIGCRRRKLRRSPPSIQQGWSALKPSGTEYISQTGCVLPIGLRPIDLGLQCSVLMPLYSDSGFLRFAQVNQVHAPLLAFMNAAGLVVVRGARSRGSMAKVGHSPRTGVHSPPHTRVTTEPLTRACRLSR